MTATGYADRRYTLEEYARLPADEQDLTELAAGRLVREPRPNSLHGRLHIGLAARIESHARDHGLGKAWVETGFILVEDPPTLRGPDIAFIATERLPVEEGRGRFVVTVPDLVVEILSPSDRRADVRQKVLEYLDAGVRLVWIVDPRTRSITVHRSRDDVRILTGDEMLEGADVLPGFSVSVAAVFDV